MVGWDLALVEVQMEDEWHREDSAVVGGSEVRLCELVG